LTGATDTGKTRTVSTYTEETETGRSFFNKLPWLGWAAAPALLVLSGVIAYWYFTKPGVQADTVTFVVMPPDKTTFGDSLAISPDGRRIAFIVVAGDGIPTLWVRPV